MKCFFYKKKKIEKPALYIFIIISIISRNEMTEHDRWYIYIYIFFKFYLSFNFTCILIKYFNLATDVEKKKKLVTF